MIDELFEGVDSAEDDEEGENLVPRSNSPLTLIPSLTRQKSKLEIKSELTVVCILIPECPALRTWSSIAMGPKWTLVSLSGPFFLKADPD